MSSRIRRASVGFITAAATCALVACSHGATTSTGTTSTSGDSSASSSASEETTTNSDTSATTPSTQATTAEGTQPINGDKWQDNAAPSQPDYAGQLVFHDIRVGSHEGFDRVVIEYVGEGTPGWTTTWANQSYEQGRGEPLPLTLPQVFDVVMTGTSMPFSDEMIAQYYQGERLLSFDGIEVAVDGTFEADTHIAIAMKEQRKVQVGVLKDPVRVVIDIQK
ncbi:AMIN-like domain-containing (lipo)protein [Schaalia suimastitidis]|uniref:AMIN-like domain-containing (lipo)protein n=1 Tax=Schaalia suimastitidis TaxID=121163 RepID=UPI0003F992C6|nr:hypothetical protein [Schaalia suimastitidis]